MSEKELRSDDVEWIVNDLAELGVKIGDQCFFLYKGRSIQYDGLHDDGTPMLYRLVDKREFGEVCIPVVFYPRYDDRGHLVPGSSRSDRYKLPATKGDGADFAFRRTDGGIEEIAQPVSEKFAWRALPRKP